jgi:hypothetical protein
MEEKLPPGIVALLTDCGRVLDSIAQGLRKRGDEDDDEVVRTIEAVALRVETALGLETRPRVRVGYDDSSVLVTDVLWVRTLITERLVREAPRAQLEKIIGLDAVTGLLERIKAGRPGTH